MREFLKTTRMTISVAACASGRSRPLRGGLDATMVRGFGLLAAIALLAACSTQVVREGGARAPHARSTPKYGATTTVARGQTLYRIATDNGISALDLAMWNAIAPPYTIYPGQRLRLYPQPGSKPSPAPASPARPVAGDKTGTATQPAATPPAAPRPPVAAVAPFAWQWPAEGQLVGRFAAGDPTRQGIDVAGQNGAPVRAAANGVVVYSGAGLVGYGELVIIKHSDDWLSAYGHNRARLVNEGQVVKAGQQIAEMGRSGAARDMLHFEIRHNGKPVDPQQYLPNR